LPITALLLLLLAHAFDYVTFLAMTSRHGLAAEANPVVVAVAQGFGLPGLTVAKLGSVIFLAAVTVLLLRTRHRRAGLVLLVIGIGAGVLGGISNVAST
jgi:hypothetical protein